MLFFIIAVITMLITWIYGSPVAKQRDEQVSAWTVAPVSPQVMDTNILLAMGSDKHLFFPSDNVVVSHGNKTPESARRVTLDLGAQKKVLLYVPQKRAIRDQQARLLASKDPICPRLSQDVNAAVLWQADMLGAQIAAETRAGKLTRVQQDPGKPMRSLYDIHLVRKPALTTEPERRAAWLAIKRKTAENINKAVEVTDLLGTDPEKVRYFVKTLPSGQLVSIWTVVPITHAHYKYRIEVEQDIERTGSAITTAIFASSDVIEPCLDLAERISAQAAQVLADTHSRVRYN